MAASPEKKFAIIFGFFRIFILPSVNLCRVLFRHSAKALPSARHAALGKEAFAECFLSGNCRALGKAFAECRKSTRQRFTLGKMELRKKHKNNSKIFQNFFSGEAATGQRPPVPIEVAAFFALNSRLTRPAGFELTISPSRVCCSTTALHCRCSTTALHCHLCLDSVIYPHILY